MCCAAVENAPVAWYLDTNEPPPPAANPVPEHPMTCCPTATTTLSPATRLTVVLTTTPLPGIGVEYDAPAAPAATTSYAPVAPTVHTCMPRGTVWPFTASDPPEMLSDPMAAPIPCEYGTVPSGPR